MKKTQLGNLVSFKFFNGKIIGILINENVDLTSCLVFVLNDTSTVGIPWNGKFHNFHKSFLK